MKLFIDTRPQPVHLLAGAASACAGNGQSRPENRRQEDARSKIPSHRAGALYDITVPPLSAARPVGNWNHARLRVDKGRIRQWLNGTLTADVPFGTDAWRRRVAASKFASMPLFGTFSSGVIALQDHGEPTEFRNIKIRRLGESAW